MLDLPNPRIELTWHLQVLDLGSALKKELY